MITEDQSAVIAFLGASATHGGLPVEQVETHASIVFLAGDLAWKLKRAVRYDYLDFSTLERRRAMCEAEVRLNQRTAPDLYLGTTPVTRESSGALALGGTDTPVEWLVAMRRFDQSLLLDRLAARGALDLEVMGPLGQAVARLHAQAPRHDSRGGADAMAWVIDGNDRDLRALAREAISAESIARLTNEVRARLAHGATRLDARRHDGMVRECHGDLHLRNLVLLDGMPTLFDGIEFNEALSCIDVAYDLSFLLMDLWRRDLAGHANAVFNAWLSATMDLGCLPLLPLLLSCRAAVRAKTTATAASMGASGTQRDDLLALTRGYVTLAQRLLAPPPPRVVAIGGLSGSGKSTLARTLAPHLGAVPGAVLIRSDEVRKRLFGISPLAHLGQDGYTPGISQKVYEEAGAEADQVARAGHAAIVDAVFARGEDREALEQRVAETGVPFVGLWLEASEAVRLDRAARRGPDVSDADAEVIRRQRSQFSGAVTWHRLDATCTPAAVLAHALRAIGTPVSAAGMPAPVR